MEKIIIRPLEEKRNTDNPRIIEKQYVINDNVLKGNVDVLAVEPLRILESLLIKKGLKINKILENNNPWAIRELEIECSDYETISNTISEIIEYRCCPEKEISWTDIIRQLPYDVMLQVSNAIMNFGKDPRQHKIDLEHSDREWEFYSFMARRQGIELNGNPNEIDDQLTIPHETPEKRKHLIYKSSRGGYNIKTQNYRDSSMDHYCWMDSKTWD